MFEGYSPESKVWIYAADRNLNAADKELISEAMNQFLPQWAAHGDSLYGGYHIVADRILILAVDEKQVYASGCSIDASVRFIKELGNTLQVDFFKRMKMIVEIEGQLNSVHISELRNYPDAFVFNPMITNLGELRSNFKVQVADSPFV